MYVHASCSHHIQFAVFVLENGQKLSTFLSVPGVSSTVNIVTLFDHGYGKNTLIIKQECSNETNENRSKSVH